MLGIVAPTDIRTPPRVLGGPVGIPSRRFALEIRSGDLIPTVHAAARTACGPREPGTPGCSISSRPRPALGHHGDKVRPIVGLCVQVRVEALLRHRDVRHDSGANFAASAFSIAATRNTLGPAPVTATRTPAAEVGDEHTDDGVARSRVLETYVGARLVPEAHRGYDFAFLQGVSYMPLKNSSATILRLLVTTVRLRPEPRPDNPPRDRYWRASRRSCPCCGPFGRRWPAARLASAGIAFFTAAEEATSA